MKTAIVTSKSSLNHNTGSGHPESISRVTSILETLKKNKKLIILLPSMKSWMTFFYSYK